MSDLPLNVFISYSHNEEDRPLLDKLVKHLAPLTSDFEGYEGAQPPRLKTWDDSHLSPGEPWDDEIKQNLRSADIVFLLVSADFNASDYIRRVEMREAIERCERGECRVVPILLRDCHYQRMPYASMEMLPKRPHDQRLMPVASKGWHSLDEAFAQVVERLEELVADIRASKRSAAQTATDAGPVPGAGAHATSPWEAFFAAHPLREGKIFSLIATVDCDRHVHFPPLKEAYETLGPTSGNAIYWVTACETQNPTSLAKRLAYWFDEDITLFFRPEEETRKDELAFYELPLGKKPEQTFGKFWALLQDKILHAAVSFDDFCQSPADYLTLPEGKRALLAFTLDEDYYRQYDAKRHVEYIAQQMSAIPAEHQRFILFFVLHAPNVHANRKADCEPLLQELDDLAKSLKGRHVSCLPPVSEGDLQLWWNGRFSHTHFADFIHTLKRNLPYQKQSACQQANGYDMEDIEAAQYAAYLYFRNHYPSAAAS